MRARRKLKLCSTLGRWERLLVRICKTGGVVVLGLALGACASRTGLRSVAEEGERGRPVLVLWSVCPSPCVDVSPRFVAYSSGVVVTRRSGPISEPPKYVEGRLSNAQRERVFGPESMKALAGLEDRYSMSEALHAPDHILQWRGPDGQTRQTVVNGVLDEPAFEQDRRNAPKAFLQVFDSIASIGGEGFRPYMPVAAEFLLLPLESCAGRTLKWPAQWPMPSPSSLGTDALVGEHVSALVPGAEFERAYRWVWAQQDAGECVEVGGRPYYVKIRAVLPGNPRPLGFVRDVKE